MVDIYLVGVGGQGIITASRIVGDAAILAGKNVLLSETHGMAQRGGSVVCTARIGDVSSPIIPDGQADAILSFELLETLRALCKTSKKTVVVSSTERIVPLSVSTQKLRYPVPEEIESEVLKVAGSYALVDAPSLSRSAGVPMSSNVVMTGALAGTGITGIGREFYERALEMNVPKRIQENLAAFSLGFDAVLRK
ncbi:MAG: indolepyruvate oxidoreductase subunit beta [Thermoplasmata archaeon]|jgi:indolepyruvate ferredoxin oxidoreductase beta subunit|nr:indolepyruvate oxidoreductase subunit beta [Thermoplasmata archaeon]